MNATNTYVQNLVLLRSVTSPSTKQSACEYNAQHCHNNPFFKMNTQMY